MDQAQSSGDGAVRKDHAKPEGSTRGWWRRSSTLWLIVAAVILPFGWILPMIQFAWVRARTRGAGKNLQTSVHHGARH